MSTLYIPTNFNNPVDYCANHFNHMHSVLRERLLAGDTLDQFVDLIWRTYWSRDVNAFETKADGEANAHDHRIVIRLTPRDIRTELLKGLYVLEATIDTAVADINLLIPGTYRVSERLSMPMNLQRVCHEDPAVRYRVADATLIVNLYARLDQWKGNTATIARIA